MGKDEWQVGLKFIHFSKEESEHLPVDALFKLGQIFSVNMGNKVEYENVKALQ